MHPYRGVGLTYFLNKLRNVRNFDPSSCNWLSAGTVGGVDWVGLGGLVFGVEVAGVTKGVFEVEVMTLGAVWFWVRW